MLFHQGHALCHKTIATMTKLHDLHFKFLPYSPHSPDLTSSDYNLFVNLKKKLAVKRDGSYVEVIAKTKSYFEALDKSFYRKVI